MDMYLISSRWFYTLKCRKGVFCIIFERIKYAKFILLFYCCMESTEWTKWFVVLGVIRWELIWKAARTYRNVLQLQLTFLLLWSENKEHSRTNDTVKRIERDKQIKQSVSQFYASLSPGTDSTSVIPSIGTIRFSFDISVYLVTKCVNRWHKYVSFSNSSNTLRWWKYACEKMR